MPRTRTRPAPSPVIDDTPAETPFANAPRRATGTLNISFGMTVIPCQVYAGTEDAGIVRSEYTRRGEDLLKVGRLTVIKDEAWLESADSEVNAVVPADQIIKVFTTDEGAQVPLSDDEIAAAVGCEGGLCQVDRFLPLSVMNTGTYIVDSLYQLRPAPARTGSPNGRSRTTESAFALLIKAMMLEGAFALCSVALRGKPRYAAFMPDGRLYTLRYTNEVRLPLALPDMTNLPDEDVMIARMVVASHTSNITPVLRDTASDAVRAYAATKAASNEVPPSVTPVVAPDRSYGDMMANLRAAVMGNALTPLPPEQEQPEMPAARRGPRIRATFADPGPVEYEAVEYIATPTVEGGRITAATAFPSTWYIASPGDSTMTVSANTSTTSDRFMYEAAGRIAAEYASGSTYRGAF